MHTIEKFVILLYDRTSTGTDIDNARHKLYTKKSIVQLIPDTRAALKQYARRAIYQSTDIRDQGLVPDPTLPSPNDLGWIKTSDMSGTLWTTIPESSKVCQEIVSYKCQKGCIKKCKCMKTSLECAALCACDGG